MKRILSVISLGLFFAALPAHAGSAELRILKNVLDGIFVVNQTVPSLKGTKKTSIKPDPVTEVIKTDHSWSVTTPPISRASFEKLRASLSNNNALESLFFDSANQKEKVYVSFCLKDGTDPKSAKMLKLNFYEVCIGPQKKGEFKLDYFAGGTSEVETEAWGTGYAKTSHIYSNRTLHMIHLPNGSVKITISYSGKSKDPGFVIRWEKFKGNVTKDTLAELDRGIQSVQKILRKQLPQLQEFQLADAAQSQRKEKPRSSVSVAISKKIGKSTSRVARAAKGTRTRK